MRTTMLAAILLAVAFVVGCAGIPQKQYDALQARFDASEKARGEEKELRERAEDEWAKQTAATREARHLGRELKKDYLKLVDEFEAWRRSQK